ncbi:MAG: hypothetical protein MJ252_12585 [archaeon]|nr:hypothetical protein [archaeon]
MSDANSFEIRVFVLGDVGVGKKTLCRKFQSLASTKTIKNDPLSTLAFIKKKKKDEEQEDTSAKNKNEENKENKENKEERQKLGDRMAIFKTVKEFEFDKGNLLMNFFPIKEADEQMNEIEEDGEIQKKTYIVGLNSALEEIAHILSIPVRDQKYNLINLLLFVYDLTNDTSLQKLEVYISELNKTIDLSENFQIALIGNKSDKRHILDNSRNEEQRNKYMEDFTNVLNKLPNGTKFYEISTSMMFNFDLFFVKLLKEVALVNSETQGLDFDKLTKKLKTKSNVSKAKRETFERNDNPGVGTYESNVYDYPTNREEYLEMFNSKSKMRYDRKIFINKKGPLFPVKSKKELAEEKERQQKKKEDEEKYQRPKAFVVERSEELKECLDLNKKGFSLGLKIGKLNLKSERQEKKKELALRTSNILKDDLKLHIKTEPVVVDRSAQFENARNEQKQKRSQRYQTNEDDIRNRHDLVLSKNEEERQNKINKIKEKEEAYNEKFKEMQAIRAMSQERSRITFNRPLIEKNNDTPGPNSYTLKGSVDATKGFTFGSRYDTAPNKKRNLKSVDLDKIDPQPKFPILQSDFDIIVKNAKKNNTKHILYGERFPKLVKEPMPEKNDFEEKMKNFEENRLNYKLKNPFLNSLEDLKENRENAKKRREELMEQKQFKIEAKFRKAEERRLRAEAFRNQKTNKDTLSIESDSEEENEDLVHKLRDINYALVEDRSPSYSMRPKYEYGSIFTTVKKDTNEDLEKEQEEFMKLLPAIKKDKNRIPGFSFGPASGPIRTEENKKKTENLNKKEPQMLFADGKFAPDDYKSFIGQNMLMGSGNKSNLAVDNGGPGPGLYKIKGFAEEVKEKGDKVNEVRTRIRNKEKEKNKKENEEKETKEEESNEEATIEIGNTKEENKEPLVKKESNTEQEYNDFADDYSDSKSHKTDLNEIMVTDS